MIKKGKNLDSKSLKKLKEVRDVLKSLLFQWAYPNLTKDERDILEIAIGHINHCIEIDEADKKLKNIQKNITKNRWR